MARWRFAEPAPVLSPWHASHIRSNCVTPSSWADTRTGPWGGEAVAVDVSSLRARSRVSAMARLRQSKERNMLIDHRTYTVKPGTLAKHLKIYEEFGLAPQKKHLG